MFILAVFVTCTEALWDVWLKALELLLSSVPATTSSSSGLCQSLLHLAKLTGLLGSPKTRHLTDLPTVSPPQITPSPSAHITSLSPSLHNLFFHHCVSVCLTSFLLLFPLPVSLLPLCIIPCHCAFYVSLTIFFSFLLPCVFLYLTFSLSSLPLFTTVSSLFHPVFIIKFPSCLFLPPSPMCPSSPSLFTFCFTTYSLFFPLSTV